MILTHGRRTRQSVSQTRFRPTLAAVRRANARFSALRQRVSDQRKTSSGPATPGGPGSFHSHNGHSTTSAPC